MDNNYSFKMLQFHMLSGHCNPSQSWTITEKMKGVAFKN